MKRGPAVRIVLAAALLVAAALLAVGVSYARYRVTERQAAEIALEYGFAPDSIFILADEKNAEGEYTGKPHDDGTGSYARPEGWTLVSEDNTVYRISFVLSNTKAPGTFAAADQSGYVEVFVTEAISSEELIVQLDTPGGKYLGAGVPVSEGSSYYRAYGSGTLYRFLDPYGERITWDLPGGREYCVPMSVTVWGEFGDPGALTVIAGGTPVS